MGLIRVHCPPHRRQPRPAYGLAGTDRALRHDGGHGHLSRRAAEGGRVRHGRTERGAGVREPAARCA